MLRWQRRTFAWGTLIETPSLQKLLHFSVITLRFDCVLTFYVSSKILFGRPYSTWLEPHFKFYVKCFLRFDDVHFLSNQMRDLRSWRTNLSSINHTHCKHFVIFTTLMRQHIIWHFHFSCWTHRNKLRTRYAPPTNFTTLNKNKFIFEQKRTTTNEILFWTETYDNEQIKLPRRRKNAKVDGKLSVM